MPPEDLLYTESHEWVREEEEGYRVGLTKHAVEELQDLVFLDLKSSGTEVEKGEPFGEVESVKAVADIYAPISGTIKTVHEEITDDLDAVFDDPFNRGWLIVMEPSDKDQLDQLMDSEAYGAYTADA